jgi:hypothetical protein
VNTNEGQIYLHPAYVTSQEQVKHDTIVVVVVVVVIVVVVIGGAMQFGVREKPGRYDSLDYDDNDNSATSIP